MIPRFRAEPKIGYCDTEKGASKAFRNSEKCKFYLEGCVLGNRELDATLVYGLWQLGFRKY